MSFKNECILFLSNVPCKTLIGIDMKYWNVGKKFRGFRSIPLGPHILYFNSSDTHTCSGLRKSLPIQFHSVGALHYEFDTKEEEDYDRVLLNEEEIKSYLGEYPSDKCFPECGVLYSADILECNTSSDSTEKEPNFKSEDNLPVMVSTENTNTRFTCVPEKRIFASSLSNEEITSNFLDKSMMFEKFLQTFDYDVNDLERFSTSYKLSKNELNYLSEVQLAFLTMIIGQKIEGWFVWRRLVLLAVSCKLSILKHPLFYEHLINILYHQLCRDSSDNVGDSNETMFSLLAEAHGDESSRSRHSEPSFLPHLLKNLSMNTRDCWLEHKEDVEQSVKDQLKFVYEAAEGLRSVMEKNFKWNLTLASASVCQYEPCSGPSELPVDEIDWDCEDAPVIVDTF